MDPQDVINGDFPSSIRFISENANTFHEYGTGNETVPNQGISLGVDNVYSTENERSNSRTRLTSGEQSMGQGNIREGLEQFRMSLDNTREGQTLLTVLKNVFPFLMLFFAKIIYDNLFSIAQFLALYGFFFQADFFIRRSVSGGFASNIVRIVYSFGFSIVTMIFFNSVYVRDSELWNTYTINIMYFLEVGLENLTMTSTTYKVLIADTAFKLITLVPKLLLLVLSDSLISATQKRRTLQMIEYCSELYRCALPFGPWLRFFLFGNPGSDIMHYSLSIIYFSLKVGEMYRYSQFVKRTFRNVLLGSSIGCPVKDLTGIDVTCIVCCSDLSQPMKLDCRHVFCKTCIETWLDQNTTCPICRAEVVKYMDNEWKNGGTSLALRFF